MNNEMDSTNQVNANTNVILLQTVWSLSLPHLTNTKHLRLKNVMGTISLALIFNNRYYYI